MSQLSQYRFEDLLPFYLTSVEKQRLKIGIEQFVNFETKEKALDYSGFYLKNAPEYLMQSDMLNSVKLVAWDDESKDFVSGFTPSVFVSNTCDVNAENSRSINNKEAMFAPIIELDQYLDDLKSEGYSDAQIASFLNTLKQQDFSNLFYLPKNEKNGKEYIVFFDKISWSPINELIKEDSLNNIRFISLSNYGFYLFILKLSYHFCRLPEEVDRNEVAI